MQILDFEQFVGFFFLITLTKELFILILFMQLKHYFSNKIVLFKPKRYSQHRVEREYLGQHFNFMLVNVHRMLCFISSQGRPHSVCRLHILAIICIGSLWVFLVGNTYKSTHVYLSGCFKVAATAEQIKWTVPVTRCCTVGQWDVLVLKDGWM